MSDVNALTREEQIGVLQEGSHNVKRLVGFGAEEGELRETLGRIKQLSDWCPEFTRLAEKYLRLAEPAKVEYARIFNYMRAAVYYHIGELFIFGPTAEKEKAHAAMVDAYAKARKHFAYPTEEVDVAFSGTTLKGYFRRLRGVDRAPCVILVRGVDACKEIELHILSNALLEQGVFTLAVDLPGQGDTRFRGMKMTPDFEKPVGAAVDYLLGRNDVDADRIGIWGMSFGGFIAPRAAALEKRIKACVSLSGFFGLDEFEFPLSAKLHCLKNMKVADESQWAETRRQYTLKDVIGQFSCPLLVVTGREEKVVPVAQSAKIFEQAREPKEMKIYEGFGHCVYYEEPAVLPVIAGWLREQLTQKRG
jgi:2,6-dihydroxypseudooxynicotine hydrolase